MAEHLTAKQDRFVDEYMADPNATQAAIHAGYSERSARSIGPENLQKPAVQQALAMKQQALAQRRLWTLERLVDQAEKHMEVALTDHPRRGPNVSAANGALEIIGRATGLLTDRPKVEAPAIITRITVVLHRGRDGEGRERVVETSSRSLEDRVLEPGDGVGEPGLEVEPRMENSQ